MSIKASLAASQPEFPENTIEHLPKIMTPGLQSGVHDEWVQTVE